MEFLSLKGGYTGSSESTLVKMPHCWKSHVAAHIYLTGIVGAAMKKKLNYNVKLKLDFNTSETATVNVLLGKGHVAAVLIVMEKFINGGPLFISKSCTEHLQAFHKPKVFGGSPMKAESLPGKRKCSLADTRPTKLRRLSGYADHVRSTVLNYCSQSSKDIAIRYFWRKQPYKQLLLTMTTLSCHLQNTMRTML